LVLRRHPEPPGVLVLPLHELRESGLGASLPRLRRESRPAARLPTNDRRSVRQLGSDLVLTLPRQRSVVRDGLAGRAALLAVDDERRRADGELGRNLSELLPLDSDADSSRVRCCARSDEDDCCKNSRDGYDCCPTNVPFSW
jgi:hypothetical protein